MTEPLTDGAGYSAERLKNAHREIAQAYLQAVLDLVAMQGGIDEVNYIKTPFKTPEGGSYLLLLQHVEGPKISIEKLRSAAGGET
jgi:hypothetical protein